MAKTYESKSLVMVSDMKPLHLSPYKILEYNGSQIISLLYSPLLKKCQNSFTNGRVIQNYIIDRESSIIKFVFNKKAAWTNEVVVKPIHYLNTIKHLVNIKSDLLSYFIFISGIQNCIENEDIFDFGVSVTDSLLTINLEWMSNYILSFFASNIWIPVLNNQETDNSHNVTTGEFHLEKEMQDRYILKRNANNNDSIIIFFQKSLERPIKDFDKGKIDFTCPTYFPLKKINDYKNRSEFHSELSNIQYILYFNKDRIHELQCVSNRKRLYENLNLELLSKKLYNGVVPWRNFIPKSMMSSSSENFVKREIHNIIERFSLTEISITFSAYYPNEVLARLLGQQLTNLGFFEKVNLNSVSLSRLCQVFNEGDYDFLIDLTFPYCSHPFAIFYCYLYLLENSDTEYYIRLLEELISKEYDDTDINEEIIALNTYLRNILPCFPLLQGKHIYMKSNKAKDIMLNTNGDISYRGGECS